MQLNNSEIIELTKKRVEDLLATLKNINSGHFYIRVKGEGKDIKSEMFDRFDEAYTELKARFLDNNNKNPNKGE